MSKLTRRRFLITGAAAVGSCFVPSWLLRRAADYEKTTGGIFIDPPESARNILYAVDQDYHFQFALNGRTDELPAPFTWREYFRDHVCIDPDDHVDVRKWLRDEGAFYFDHDNLRYAYRHLHFLDEQVHDRIWENYLEGPYAVYDSPEARALHYLDALPLSNGTGPGDPLGDLKFHYGTMPAADWHFVNAEGREVLIALQQRDRRRVMVGEESRPLLSSRPVKESEKASDAAAGGPGLTEVAPTTTRDRGASLPYGSRMDRPAFASLGLSPEILKAVDKLGFEEASPIQAAAIPALLAGHDVVGQSQTGSGKTAAFAIPAIEKTDPALHAVQVLVLCPTRELATQVAGEVHKLSAGKRGVHAVPVYGGSSFERQAQELKRGAQIVLGTPGRIIDHLERGTLKLDRLRLIVLDEADRMLDMGFRDDIKKILDAMPADRQTAFFSATVSPAIRKLIDRYARDPVTLKIDQKKVDAPDIAQWYYETPPRMKFDALLRLIDFYSYRSGIIFCNTQRTVDELADDLQAQGIPSDRLHGGIAQAQRTRVMNKFKAGGFDFLVATDVAGRGIDVDDLELVVNFDLPYDPEDYVHRIGRTGRAGKQGVAVSLVTGRDLHKIKFLERFTHATIRRGKLPTAGEIGEKRTDALLERVRRTIEAGSARAQMVHVDRLLEEGADSTEVAAALLHILNGGEAGAPVSPPSEKSRPVANPTAAAGDTPGAADEPPRKAKPGKAWLRVGLARDAVTNPRDIVDLLVEAAGLASREVGFIALGHDSSYAEVPIAFCQGLSPSGNVLQGTRGDVTIWPVRHPAGKKRR